METTKTTFTPGPWLVFNEDRPEPAWDVYTADETTHIASAHYDSVGHEAIAQGRANARLIAAAPEMYEALEMALDVDRLHGFMATNDDDGFRSVLDKYPSLFNHEMTDLTAERILAGAALEKRIDALKKARGE